MAGTIPGFGELNFSEFDKEVSFPNVILSYQSNATGKGRGKLWMWALSNELRQAGITTFNGYMVKGGQDWQEKWFGHLPMAKICVAMMSSSYFGSQACIDEIKAACSEKIHIIPVFLEHADMRVGFLGPDEESIIRGNFLRTRLSGNCIPPPDKGFFQGSNASDFKRNCRLLATEIKRVLQTMTDNLSSPKMVAPAAHVARKTPDGEWKDGSRVDEEDQQLSRQQVLDAFKSAFNGHLHGNQVDDFVTADGELGLHYGKIKGDKSKLRAVCDLIANNITTSKWTNGKLYLNDNNLGPEEGKAIAAALAKNTTLKEIYLNRNGLGPEGGKAIAAALAKNTTLTRIYLEYNNLTDEVEASLRQCASNRSTLTVHL
jgi:hypothetical protein